MPMEVKLLGFTLLNAFCLSRKYIHMDMCVLTYIHATIYTRVQNYCYA